MRRAAVLLSFVLVSVVIAACTDVTAPRGDDLECKSGYVSSGGRCVPADSVP